MSKTIDVVKTIKEYEKWLYEMEELHAKRPFNKKLLEIELEATDPRIAYYVNVSKGLLTGVGNYGKLSITDINTVIKHCLRILKEIIIEAKAKYERT
jgi:hypothetical protein